MAFFFVTLMRLPRFLLSAELYGLESTYRYISFHIKLNDPDSLFVTFANSADTVNVFNHLCYLQSPVLPTRVDEN